MTQSSPPLETADRDAIAASLSLCLAELLAFHERRVDIAAALKQLPRRPGPLDWNDLPALCHALDLDCFNQVLSPAAALAQVQPLLLKDPTGRAQILMPRADDPKLLRLADTSDGATASLEVTGVDGVAASTSPIPALIVRPRRERHAASTDHMLQERGIDWFWRPLASFWPRFAEVFVCSILINLFVLLLPLFTLNVYDQVIPNFAEETLIVLCVGIGIALLFDLALKSIRSYVLEMVAARVGATFDGELMGQMLSVRPEQLTLSIGERLSLFRELQGIREFYAAKLVPTVVDLPFFVLFIAVIYVISPTLAVVPVAVALLVLATSALIQLPINRATASQFAALQHKSSALLETLAQAPTIRSHNAVGHRRFRWNSIADASAQSARYSQFLFATSQNLALTFVHAVHVLIVLVGVYQIQEGVLTIGGLIACTILAGRAMAPIVNVGGVVARWRQSRDVLKSIDAVFDLPREPGAEDQDSGAQDLSTPCLVTRHLSYSYPGASRPALDDVSLSINAGEHIALIGPSGAGKSTLAGLLGGVLTQYTGTLHIAGVDRLKIAPAALRDAVAFVPQQPQLISGTIRDNITLGLDVVEPAALAEACHVSALNDLLTDTELGLDTPVGGDRGGDRGGLSGGQLQAVCLARAIVRDPRVIIFDEPATGLDAAVEQQVRSRLQSYLKGRTLIMITHRTSLLALVERLVLLERGRVVADGPKADVLARFTTRRSAA
ncbi:MAG: ATP-binding cassette domain-containing protein [Pseudomonadota bacterium]